MMRYRAHTWRILCTLRALSHALCIFALCRHFANRGWGRRRSLLAYPPHLIMHLTDIFGNCRPKLPPFGALDTVDQALSSALLSAHWDTRFCILLQRYDHSPMTEVRIPPPLQRQVTSNTCHILNMRSPFNIIAYMHSARPTIHIYISISVLL